ncbi:MAG: 3-isopropylmalate dehydratase large subunit [Candidatus Omnitrophica bacterium]|nr:3-isopropylmalate dehydratase large subunit [Candidatus Omnitrophota bacterium]
MGKTLAEKILTNHAGRDVHAGDIAVCNVDFCFGQDGTSGLIMESFKKLGANVFDKTRFAMVIDHSSPSPNIGVSTVHKAMRDFANEKEVKLFDVGEGVCHQLIPERGYVTCGDLILGADSHTCTYGALNALATGVGSTDLAITVATGKNWFKVPESIKIIVSGKMPAGTYSKDIILHIIGTMGAKAATYKSVEFYGNAIKALSVDSRFTISNMAIEMGAKFGIMEADPKVLKWVKQHSIRQPNPAFADPDAHYGEVREFDITKLAPQVARPHTVDNVVSVEAVGGVKIDEGVIGTCTNGRLEDLEVAAKILKNRKIHRGVKMIVAPASKGIYLEAVKRGFVEIFVDAGAMVVAPGCGPCVGTHNGVLADNETAISTANRNFKGRMGNPNSNIYLGSPATVAASCLTGRIADPREHKKRLL